MNFPRMCHSNQVNPKRVQLNLKSEPAQIAILGYVEWWIQLEN